MEKKWIPSEEVKEVYRSLSMRPVAFYPAYVLLTKSIPAAVLLSQIMYLFSRFGTDRFFHTDAQFMGELYMPLDTLRSAKKIIRSVGFIDVVVKGVPPKTVYTIDWDAFHSTMGKIPQEMNSYVEFHKLNCGNSIDRNMEFPQNIKETEEKEISKSHSCADAQESVWEKLAFLFMESTCLDRKRKPSMKTWGVQLKSFAKREEIPLKRIKTTLKWYSRQFDKEKNPYSRKYLPKYTPQANSMSGFIGKFFDIERAMLKQTENEQSSLTIDDLSTDQRKHHDRMESELKMLMKARLGTLPDLVVSLSSALDIIRRKVQESDLHKKTKARYLDGILIPRVFFDGYAMWISGQVPNWNGKWSGDLGIFHPSGKHFLSYMEHKGLCESSTMREIVNEAHKG